MDRKKILYGLKMIQFPHKEPNMHYYFLSIDEPAHRPRQLQAILSDSPSHERPHSSDQRRGGEAKPVKGSSNTYQNQPLTTWVDSDPSKAGYHGGGRGNAEVEEEEEEAEAEEDYPMLRLDYRLK